MGSNLKIKEVEHIGVVFDPKEKKQLFSLRDTAMRLRSQRLLHVQRDAGQPG
jgi:hypothetical protein